MPRNDDIDIDEKDFTRIGKVLLPFFIFFILSLYFQQYWESIEWTTQIAVILLLMLIATLVYRNDIKEMLYD